MSQHRSLRLQNLPGRAEALALNALITKDQATLKLGKCQIPVPLLANVLANSFHQEKKLDILVNSRERDRIRQFLAQNNLDHLYIESSDLKDKTSLTRKIQKILSYESSSPDTRGSWKRFHKIVEQLSYGDFVVDQVTMGEKPLHAIMERYLELKARFSNTTIEESLTRAEFEFDAKEYWHIRGRVRDALSRYSRSFDHLDALSELHPVFVEMYRPDEAENLIEELLKQLQHRLLRIESELHQWIVSYRRHYLNELSEFGLLVRDHAFSLVTEIQEVESQKSETSDESRWTWLSRNSNDQNLATEQITSAYNSLRKMVDERGLTNIYQLPETDQMATIQQILNELLTNFHTVRKKLKRFVDEHIGRTNAHNIAIDIFQHRYDLMRQRLQDLLEDINGKQVFRKYWEDNTLDIVSQKRWLEQVTRFVRSVIQQSSQLRPYLEWKQFLSLIDARDLQILEVLKLYPKEEWLDRYDLWYYENFIEAQDLIPFDYNHHLKDFARFSKALFRSNWQYSEKSTSSTLKKEISTFLKKHRRFKLWLEKPEAGHEEINESILREFGAIFPIRIIDTVDSARNEQPGSRWLLSTHLEDTTVPGLRLISEAQEDDIARYVPNVKPSIIHSDHTDRINEIKAISEFLLQSGQSFEIWQNQKSVYFSLMEHGAQDLIFDLMPTDMRRTIINHSEQMDVIVETMLNHKGREFFCLLSQHHNWSRDNWSQQLEHQRLIRFLSYVGFQPLYISWQSIFKNAEIVAFLKREKQQSRQSEGLSAVKDSRS